MTETIFERSVQARRAFVAPELDVPEVDPQALLPAGLRRSEPAALPEHNALLVAITELRSRADIDRLAEVVGEAVAA